MPVTVTNIENVPRATRNKKRALEGTDEWVELKSKLAEGLKPFEAIYITFTPQQIQQLGLKTVGRIFLLMTKAYIKKLGLQYDAWRYHSEGKEVVVVAGRGVNAKQGAVEIEAPRTVKGKTAPPVKSKKRA